MSYFIDERLLATDRGLIAILKTRSEFDNSIKPGMLVYIVDEKTMYSVTARGVLNRLMLESDISDFCIIASGALANIPTAARKGSYYLATDTFEMYLNEGTDTQAVWTKVLSRGVTRKIVEYKNVTLLNNNYYTPNTFIEVFPNLSSIDEIDRSLVDVYVNGMLIPKDNALVRNCGEVVFTPDLPAGAVLTIQLEFFV